MSEERMVVVIARAGVQLGNHAVITEFALRQMAGMASTPYIKYREADKSLIWDGPADAYYDYFHHAAADREAASAIQRAMRKS